MKKRVPGQESGLLEMAGRIFTPVLIHWLACLLLECIVQTVGLHADAAFLTTLAAVLVLPVLTRMMKSDEALRLLQRKEEERGASEPKPFGVMAAAEVTVLAVLCNLVLTVAVNAIADVWRLPNEVQETLLSGKIIVQLVGIAVIVPIMEEVLFRGLVYRRLTDYNNGWLAPVSAAAIFALYHGNLIQILFAFPMGLVIIAVYRRWETLKAPMVFHVAVNLSSVLISMLAA